MSVTLVAFASAAIAAAHWRTRGVAPEADPLVIDETTGTFGRGGDIQLGTAATPLFTLEVPTPAAPDAAGTPDASGAAPPVAIFAGGGHSDGHDSASYSAQGRPGFTFGDDHGTASPRRASSGGTGSGGSIGGASFGFGGGAWGGVSGSAPRPASAAAVAPAAARAKSTVPAPKVGSPVFGSAGGSSVSSNGSGSPAGRPASPPLFGSSLVAPPPGPPVTPSGSLTFGASSTNVAAGPVAVQADTAPIYVSDGFQSGLPAAGDPGSGGPGSAPTPEPVTLLLVGLGAAALYGARRHFV